LLFGLQQGGEVGDRRLLLAQCLVGELTEAPADRGELELGGVRLDQRLERLGARVATYRASWRPSRAS